MRNDLSLQSAAVVAQPGDDNVTVNETRGKVDLSNYFEYLKETGPALKLEDVTHRSNLLRWHSAAPDGLLFGYQKQPLWLRSRIYNPFNTEQQRILQLALPMLDRAEMYIERRSELNDTMANQPFNSVSTASLERVTSLPRNLRLPLNFRAREEITIYLRVESPVALNFAPILWSPKDFYPSASFDYAGKSFCCGLIIAVLIYCLVKFYRRQDAGYGFLAMYLSGLSVLLAALSGILSEHVWPGNLAAEKPILMLGMFLCSTAGMLFTCRVASVCHSVWPLFQLLIMFAFIGFVAVFADVVLPNPIALPMIILSFAGIAVVAIVTGVLGSLRKNVADVLYTVGWLIMLGAAVLLGLDLIIGMDPRWPVDYVVFAAAAVQAVLFCLALIESEQSAIKQRQMHQSEALLHARISDQRHSEALALERLARLSEQAALESQILTNETLEKKIMQLTRELHKSYRELQRLADMDVATGLKNRNYCLCNLSDAIDEFVQNSREFSLLIVEFDLFKSANKRLSVTTREAFLREAAHALQEQLPGINEADFSYLDGERFAVILRDFGTDKIQLIANQLFEDLRVYPFTVEDGSRTVPLAIGAASSGDIANPSAEILLQAAERALRVSKNLSSRQVCVGAFGLV